eukprot:3791568-Prymnesium_polylepis.1
MDGWPPLKKAVLVEVGAIEVEGACLRAVRPALVLHYIILPALRRFLQLQAYAHGTSPDVPGVPR